MARYNYFRVIWTLCVLVVIFSIVWSSPAQTKRAYKSIPSSRNFPVSGRNSHGQGRFFLSNFMLPNLTSLSNLFKINGSSISFVPLGQLLFSG